MRIKLYLTTLLLFFVQHFIWADHFTIQNGDVAGLRAALQITYNNNKPDTIFLAYKGKYVLSSTDMTGSPLESGLVIEEDHLNPQNRLVIYGNGSEIERDNSAAKFRLLFIIGTAEFHDLHLKNGLIDSQSDGGAISNSGNLSLFNCTLSNNGGGYRGGAIYGGIGGSINLANCTITSCYASFGAAVFVLQSPAEITNCTITGNYCTGNTGHGAVVSGLFSVNPNYTFLLTNNIIAFNKDGNNADDDVDGALSSGGGNVIGVNKSQFAVYFNQTRDKIGTAANPINPLLGTLQVNNGLTPSIPLNTETSPAFQNGVNRTYTPEFDQAGNIRVSSICSGSTQLNAAVFSNLRPQFRLRQNGNLIPHSTGLYTFANTPVGQQSALATFEIKNNMNSETIALNLLAHPAVFLASGDTDDFTVVTNSLTNKVITYNNVGSTSFDVIFNPKTAGSKSAKIWIPTNDKDYPVFEFTVSGEASSVLPISTRNFSAKALSNRIILTWTNTSLYKNFIVERSSDGKEFTAIASINVNQQSSGNYQINDDSPLSGTNYYRLKEIDRDGLIETAGIIMIDFKFQKDIAIEIFPLPAKDHINISFKNHKNKAIELSITDLKGVIIHQEKFILQEENAIQQINLPQKSIPGMYILNLQGDGLNKILKFLWL